MGNQCLKIIFNISIRIMFFYLLHLIILYTDNIRLFRSKIFRKIQAENFPIFSQAPYLISWTLIYILCTTRTCQWLHPDRRI